MPRPYELMVLVMPELAEEALTAEVDHINGILTDNGAQITFLKRDTPWGRRRLAYPIGRFRDANYMLYRFNAPPGAVRAIERDLKLDERVIRYLFVRLETVVEEPEQEQAEGAEEAPAEQPVAAEAAPEQPAAGTPSEEPPAPAEPA